MADRSRTVKKLLKGLYFNAEFGEVTVSNADTFTLGSFKATVNPSNVYLMKEVDGAEMTNTHAAGTNVVTISGAGTDIPCVYMAHGVKA